MLRRVSFVASKGRFHAAFAKRLSTIAPSPTSPQALSAFGQLTGAFKEATSPLPSSKVDEALHLLKDHHWELTHPLLTSLLVYVAKFKVPLTTEQLDGLYSLIARYSPVPLLIKIISHFLSVPIKDLIAPNQDELVKILARHPFDPAKLPPGRPSASFYLNVMIRQVELNNIDYLPIMKAMEDKSFAISPAMINAYVRNQLYLRPQSANKMFEALKARDYLNPVIIVSMFKHYDSIGDFQLATHMLRCVHHFESMTSRSLLVLLGDTMCNKHTLHYIGALGSSFWLENDERTNILLSLLSTVLNTRLADSTELIVWLEQFLGTPVKAGKIMNLIPVTTLGFHDQFFLFSRLFPDRVAGWLAGLDLSGLDHGAIMKGLLRSLALQVLVHHVDDEVLAKNLSILLRKMTEVRVPEVQQAGSVGAKMATEAKAVEATAHEATAPDATAPTATAPESTASKATPTPSPAPPIRLCAPPKLADALVDFSSGQAATVSKAGYLSTAMGMQLTATSMGQVLRMLLATYERHFGLFALDAQILRVLVSMMERRIKPDMLPVLFDAIMTHGQQHLLFFDKITLKNMPFIRFFATTYDFHRLFAHVEALRQSGCSYSGMESILSIYHKIKESLDTMLPADTRLETLLPKLSFLSPEHQAQVTKLCQSVRTVSFMRIHFSKHPELVHSPMYAELYKMVRVPDFLSDLRHLIISTFKS